MYVARNIQNDLQFGTNAKWMVWSAKHKIDTQKIVRRIEDDAGGFNIDSVDIPYELEFL